MKTLKKILLLSLALLFVLMPAASAVEPYVTYTYGTDGFPRTSPTVYTPIMNVDSAYIGLEKAMDDPRDLFVDDDGNVYIVDAANNRIIVTDSNFKLKFTITDFINDQGIPDSFTNPSGVFVTDKSIYVCDTDANRIVIFDRDGNFERILGKPTSALFGEESIYKPVAVAVDQYDRIFVISSTTYQGVIVLTQDGEFAGFIGAQKVTYSVWEIFWRRFQTEEQRKSSMSYVPTEYNNISIDDEGFIYVTSSSITARNQYAQIRNKSSRYSPVKKLNAVGKDVMNRLARFAPAGEVNVDSSSVSRLIDVAVGPAGTWSVIDEKRQKVYTYDQNGHLLFAFGDSGGQLGNLTNIEAVAYQGDYMLLLDKSDDLFTVYKRTEYGDILISAVENEKNRQFDKAIEYWQEILKRNSNFDLAYIGIGRSLYNSGNYTEAMEYYKAAYDTSNYSAAFQEVRKQWINDYFLLLPLGAIALILLWRLFSKYTKKKNRDTALKVGKKTYWEELLYVFHLIYHPFDGFWDLKHEKRGSVRAAVTILALTILTFYYNAIGRGYIVQPTPVYTTIFSQAVSVLLPVMLWVISNWCLTTLFEGEGSFKDVFVASCYSLFPLVLTILPVTIISNVVLATETNILTLLTNIGFIWTGLLLFFGSQTTHDYTLGKNIVMTVATIVGMAIVMFIGILFTSLISNMMSFVTNIVVELQYRM